MSDQQFASSVTSLYDGTADRVLVAAGAGQPVGQLTAAQLRTLCSVYSTSDVDTAVGAKVSKSGDTMTGALSLGANAFTCGAIAASGIVTLGPGGNSTQQVTFTPNSGTTCGFGMTNGGASLDLFVGSTRSISFQGSYLCVVPSSGIYWTTTAGNPTTTRDTGISRASAGVVAIGTGDQGSVAGSLSCAAITASGRLDLGNSALGAEKINVYGTTTSPMMTLQTASTTSGTGIAFAAGSLSSTFRVLTASVNSVGSLSCYLQNNGNGNVIYDTLLNAGTGDAFSRYNINGGVCWSAGLDNSDGDSYVISRSSVLGTNNAVRIDTSNNVDFYGNVSTSGGISAGAVTFSVLNATTATATLGLHRITDRGNKLAYPDGTNWRFVSDDAIIS